MDMIGMITKQDTLYKVFNGKYECNLCGKVIDRMKQFYIPLVCMHAFCSECVELINENIVVNRKTNEHLVLICPRDGCQKCFTKIIKCNFNKQSQSQIPEEAFQLVAID